MSTAASHPEAVSCQHVPLPTEEQLPNDLDTLKRMVLELLATLHEERQDKARLRHRLDLLLRRLYGPRHERFSPDQLLLFDAAAAEPDKDDDAQATAAPPAAAASTPAASKRRSRPHGRRPLPEDLPRRPVHHELSEAERLCVCGQTRLDIGTEVSEQLDWRPATFFVWQHLVHKYLCPACARRALEAAPHATAAGAAATAASEPAPAATGSTEPAAGDMSAARPTPAEAVAPSASAPAVPLGPAIVSAAKPAMPIAKGLPGPGLLAQIIVSKYFDHLPLYRQENIFRRQGVFLARSTTCDWMAACAERLRPLYDAMVALVLQSRWLHTDDTPVKNLGHAPGTTATARFWIYWGDRDHPCNVFDFTLNRKRDGPQSFLVPFHGYLHADAFSGYDALYLPLAGADGDAIIEVACNCAVRGGSFTRLAAAMPCTRTRRWRIMPSSTRSSGGRRRTTSTMPSGGNCVRIWPCPSWKPSTAGWKRSVPRCCPRARCPRRLVTR